MCKKVLVLFCFLFFRFQKGGRTGRMCPCLNPPMGTIEFQSENDFASMSSVSHAEMASAAGHAVERGHVLPL